MQDKIIVTGATGFVGKALCKALVELGYSVIGLVRKRNTELESIGVTQVTYNLSTDFTENDHIIDAFKHSSDIFHTAAKVEMWGKYDEFYRVNVLGTRQLLLLAKLYDIKRFIFTSSPSVIAGRFIASSFTVGKCSSREGLNGVNEDYPYPEEYDAFYPCTKAIAEKEVLENNNQNGLLTIALRPHLIFGNGDTNLIPAILKKADSGKLIQVGSGTNITDVTYIDDCISAHLASLKALKETPDQCSGKPYFITQGDPVSLWWFINAILKHFNRMQITRKIPTKVAFALSCIAEKLTLPNKEPILTKFLVKEMSTNHYFDISAAKKDLGYTPSCKVVDAISKISNTDIFLN
jgi:2-alkyl-3-oxoalkanoate reductase